MFEFNLAPRSERSQRWEENEMINAAIAIALKHSVRRWTSEKHSAFIASAKSFPTMLALDDTPLGSSTIREGGHAVCCFAQGMAFKTKESFFEDSLAPIADKIASSGYYEDGKGIYHNLFDHVGCRRATDIVEIINAIFYNESMATLLVDNSLYHGEPERTGRTYINVKGLDCACDCPDCCSCDILQQTLIIDDPFQGQIKKDFVHVAKSIIIAWIW